MGALEVLFWILAALGGVILLTIIAFVILLIFVAAGMSRMREVEEQEHSILHGKAEQ